MSNQGNANHNEHPSEIAISQNQYASSAAALIAGIKIIETAFELEKQKAEEEKKKLLNEKNKKNLLIPDIIKENTYNYEMLKGCLFVGHINTDLDSIAGAIAAAHLYDGVPLAASELNTETQWALEKWGFECPTPVESYKNLEKYKVCLVDHNQLNQVHPMIKQNQIVGVIDHHALQANTLTTANPIYLDIRPWGSMSTILAKRFMKETGIIPKDIAGLLLSAILSDTLNFKSPTCTEMDKVIAITLAKIVEVDDLDVLANEQFKAKSKELEKHSIAELIRGDMKSFDFNAQIPSNQIWSGSFAWATVECITYDGLLDKKEEIVEEINAAKKEMNLDMFFFSAVDIQDQKSVVFLASDLEREVVMESFKTTINPNSPLLINNNSHYVDVGNLVSRKAEFIPAVMQAIDVPEWEPSDNAKKDSINKMKKDFGALVQVQNSKLRGTLERLPSTSETVKQLENNKPSSFSNAKAFYELEQNATMNWSTAIYVHKFVSKLKKRVREKKQRKEELEQRGRKSKKQKAFEKKMMALGVGLTCLSVGLHFAFRKRN